MFWPIGLPPKRAFLTAVLNQSKRLRLSRHKRASHLTLDGGAQRAAEIALESFGTIRLPLGDLRGKTGIEIGPGDNLGVAHCCFATGAAGIIAIEQYPSVRRSTELAAIIGAALHGTAGDPEVQVTRFEDYRGPTVDFIYSIDVVEHVSDVTALFRQVARLLKPDGLSVHSIDFAGHNAYAGTGIAFLACPDPVWKALHSHLITSNRIRFSEALTAMRDAGLTVESVDVTRRAGSFDLQKIRPYILPRWQHLADDDLTVLQAVISARKPRDRTSSPGLSADEVSHRLAD